MALMQHPSHSNQLQTCERNCASFVSDLNILHPKKSVTFVILLVFSNYVQ